MAARLLHVEGLRALACLWILHGHWAYRPRGESARILDRGFVPVGFFIFLSGFITEYAAAASGRELATRGAVLRFHAQRIGRILPLHWLNVLLAAGPLCFWPWLLDGRGYAADCWSSLILLTSWRCYAPTATEPPVLWAEQCPHYQPNNLHWTLSTLLFSWLCFPALHRALARYAPAARAAPTGAHDGPPADRAARALLLLLGAALVGSLAPACLLHATGRDSWAWFQLAYKFPPMRLPDFAAGMVAGRLAIEPALSRWAHLHRLPDLAALAIIAALVLTPSPTLPPDAGPEALAHPPRQGSEILLVAAFNGAFAALLLGGCAPHAADRSVVTAAASYAPMQTAGKYSFHVYLLQVTPPPPLPSPQPPPPPPPPPPPLRLNDENSAISSRAQEAVVTLVLVVQAYTTPAGLDGNSGEFCDEVELLACVIKARDAPPPPPPG